MSDSACWRVGVLACRTPADATDPRRYASSPIAISGDLPSHLACWRVASSPCHQEGGPLAHGPPPPPPRPPPYNRAVPRTGRPCVQYYFFHLMSWPYLPDDFEAKHDSAWVWVPNSLYDPVKGHHLYRDYLDTLALA